MLLRTIRSLYFERGLDLSKKDNEGYLAGILVNGNTPDRGRVLMLQNAKSLGATEPTVELQEGLLNDPEIQLPLTGVVVGETSLRKANEVLSKKYQNLIDRGVELTPEISAEIYMSSLIEVGMNGVDLGGVTVVENVVRFDKQNRRVRFTSREGSDRTKCLLGYSEAILMLWDGRSRMIGQVSLPFQCR